MLTPSTPADSAFRATFRHAASRVVGRMTLSIKLYHLPPLTPSTSADTIRSVQIDASAHHHRRSASVPGVALSGTFGTPACLIPDLAHPASCLPSLGPVLLPGPLHRHRRHRGNMKALTPANLTQIDRSHRLLRLAFLAFRPQPRHAANRSL